MAIEFDYQRLPFDQAIEFLADKTNLDADSWLEGMGISQDSYFTVAKAKGDLLQEIRDAVQKALEEGISVQEFVARFNQIADRWADNWNLNGDRAWRADLIYTTNLRTAYAAGRYNQQTQKSTMKARKFWLWRHGGSRLPRLAHLALDGKVFEVADADGEFTTEAKAFFVDGGMYPPIGFGCRCQVFTLSDRDLERRGLAPVPTPKVGDALPFKDENGRDVNPVIKPDEGFDFVPGAAKPKVKKLDPDIQKQVDNESNARTQN